MGSVAKKLEAAGLPTPQAEAIADAFREATSEEVVTRDYLDARLEAAKGDLIKWVAGLLMAQAVLIAALVKLL
ncbi:CCDC90 family protein [Candidatus Thiodictyon syntrophicum]|uniref:CCDC90 family protein n=1 Tax=Candidatus Thiodictyon syntrophicum TaxID=1166950 RepID=UPI001C12C4B9|nr:CCDC90 family protein [Candidatus Thiodictyon syntrophicum]